MLLSSRKFPLIWDSPIAMQKSLQKVGLPRSIRDKMVIRLKSMTAPGALKTRKALAGEISAPQNVDMTEFRATGATAIAQDELGGASSATTALNGHFDTLRTQGRLQTNSDTRKGLFLLPVSTAQELLDIPAVRDMMLGRDMLGLVSNYFGEVPVLSNLSLMWSPPNEVKQESQLYHLDGEDKTQLKILLAVHDVTPQSGPFTYVSADVAQSMPPQGRQSTRLADEDVEARAGDYGVRQALGPKGSVFAVDTARCLHYGSRGNSVERVMLFMHFNRYLAPKAPRTHWQVNAEALNDADQSLVKSRRLLLDLAD